MVFIVEFVFLIMLCNIVQYIIRLIDLYNINLKTNLLKISARLLSYTIQNKNPSLLRKKKDNFSHLKK